MRTKTNLLYVSLLMIVVASGFLMYTFSTNKSSRAATHGTNMTLTVLEYIAFDLTQNPDITFGDLTPGTPIPMPSASGGGTIASVTTNAVNGYTLAVHDGIASTNSALVHTDTTTYIPDFNATIASPAGWVNGTSKGLGITLYGGDHAPNVKWCSGVCTTYNDTDNNYAGIPETATIIDTITGYHAGADTSIWAFKVDAANTQKTGAYAGSITWTALPVTS